MSYKSAIRSQPPNEQPDQFKYRKELRQLQEAFPNWTNDGMPDLNPFIGIHLTAMHKTCKPFLQRLVATSN
jgi:hypothetical protein